MRIYGKHTSDETSAGQSYAAAGRASEESGDYVVCLSKRERATLEYAAEVQQTTAEVLLKERISWLTGRDSRNAHRLAAEFCRDTAGGDWAECWPAGIGLWGRTGKLDGITEDVDEMVFRIVFATAERVQGRGQSEGGQDLAVEMAEAAQ